MDEQIIKLLQKNARLSNKQIATEVGIAESTYPERIRKLNSPCNKTHKVILTNVLCLKK
ncbi:MAG: AsnC family protein [Tenacibaculum sp.]